MKPLFVSIPCLALVLLLSACGKSSTPSATDPTFGKWLTGTWQDADDAQFKIRISPNFYEEEARFKVTPQQDERLVAEIRCRYRQTGDVRIETPNEKDLADSQGKTTPDHVIVMTISRRDLLEDTRNGAGCKAFLDRANEKPQTNVILIKKVSDTEFVDVLADARYLKI